MNTTALCARDIDAMDRYETLARLTALDRAYGMVEFDLDGRMVSVNPCFATCWAIPEALVGQSHLMLLPPDLQAGMISSGRRYWVARSSRGSFAGSGKVAAPLAPCHLHARDRRGRHPAGVVKLAHDITSAVMAKQRVEQQSQLFDIVVARTRVFCSIAISAPPATPSSSAC